MILSAYKRTRCENSYICCKIKAYFYARTYSVFAWNSHSFDPRCFYFGTVFTSTIMSHLTPLRSQMAFLHPLQHWLDTLEIQNATIAKFICRLIPASCPFARQIIIGNLEITIPPLCQLNPFYDHLVGLRLRALNYLAAIEPDSTL